MSESGKTLEPGQSIKPKASSDDAIRLIKDFFGIQVSRIKGLNSYDDGRAEDGGNTGKYVFKILNSMDSKNSGHIQAEGRAMNLLSQKGFNCSVPMKTKDGGYYATVSIGKDEKDLSQENFDGREVNIIRLLRFVEGKLFTEVKLTEKLLFDTGKYIAKMETDMEELETKGLEGHTSIWFMTSVPDLRKFIYVLDKESYKKELVEDILSTFEEKAKPLYPLLPQGVVHGDFNEQNIICREDGDGARIEGVIDFGDLHVGYYVYELGVTMCYMMLECVKVENNIDPLIGAGHVLAGYASVRAVNEKEMGILRLCIAARFCQSLVMGAYTFSQDPGNMYLLTTAGRGWSLLENLWRKRTDAEAIEVWGKIVESYAK